MRPEELTPLQFPYAKNVILLFNGGSKMYGTNIQDKADTDIYGIFVEPKEKVLGVDTYEHFVYHTNKEGRGEAGPEDVDVCLYSLRRFASLACKGNPSVLSFLFATPSFQHFIWCRLHLKRNFFLAKSHIGSFLGYANDQLQRLYGARGQKNCNRPFLEQQHGYDTKYAIHILRLLLEVRELMEYGKITYPNPRADWLREVRQGKYKLFEIKDIANDLEVEAIQAKERSELPERVDRDKVSQLISELYLEYWK